MKLEDNTELHKKLLSASDSIFSFLQSQKIQEKVAFLALCLCLARLTIAINQETDVAHTLIKIYRRACERTQERNKAEKEGMLN